MAHSGQRKSAFLCWIKSGWK